MGKTWSYKITILINVLLNEKASYEAVDWHTEIVATNKRIDEISSRGK